MLESKSTNRRTRHQTQVHLAQPFPGARALMSNGNMSSGNMAVVGGSSGLWEVLTVSMPFLSPSVSVGKEEAEMKNVS